MKTSPIKTAISLLTLFSYLIINLTACDESTNPRDEPVSPFNQTYIIFTNWHDSGVPELLSHKTGLDKYDLLQHKGKACWFNYFPSDIFVSQILNEYTNDVQTNILNIYYNPSMKGDYNTNSEYVISEYTWGGTTTLISELDAELLNSNIDSVYMYFWLKLLVDESEITMQIDIGTIDEDIIPNGILDSEDRSANELLDNGEDAGIDAIFDIEENGYDPDSNPDPHGDNFYLVNVSLNPEDYISINSTEGNSQIADIGKYPDTEDLNRNFILDMDNDYYTYEIPITLMDNNYLIEFNEESGWGLLKIPLSNYSDITGSPQTGITNKIRIWFNGYEDEIYLRVAEIKFSRD